MIRIDLLSPANNGEFIYAVSIDGSVISSGTIRDHKKENSWRELIRKIIDTKIPEPVSIAGQRPEICAPKNTISQNWIARINTGDFYLEVSAPTREEVIVKWNTVESQIATHSTRMARC